MFIYFLLRCTELSDHQYPYRRYRDYWYEKGNNKLVNIYHFGLKILQISVLYEGVDSYLIISW